MTKCGWARIRLQIRHYSDHRNKIWAKMCAPTVQMTKQLATNTSINGHSEQTQLPEEKSNKLQTTSPTETMKTERTTTKSTRLIWKTACVCVLYIIGISIANIDKLRQFIERRIHCTQFTRTHERARSYLNHKRKIAVNYTQMPLCLRDCWSPSLSQWPGGGRVHTKKWPIRSHTLTYAWRIYYTGGVHCLILYFGCLSGWGRWARSHFIYNAPDEIKSKYSLASHTWLCGGYHCFFSYSKYLFNSVVHNFFSRSLRLCAITPCWSVARIETQCTCIWKPNAVSRQRLQIFFEL